jgi:hypothetical protein
MINNVDPLFPLLLQRELHDDFGEPVHRSSAAPFHPPLQQSVTLPAAGLFTVESSRHAAS